MHDGPLHLPLQVTLDTVGLFEAFLIPNTVRIEHVLTVVLLGQVRLSQPQVVERELAATESKLKWISDFSRLIYLLLTQCAAVMA